MEPAVQATVQSALVAPCPGPRRGGAQARASRLRCTTSGSAAVQPHGTWEHRRLRDRVPRPAVPALQVRSRDNLRARL